MRAIPTQQRSRLNKTVTAPVKEEKPDFLFPQHTEHIERVNKARDEYINYEKKNLQSQIQDL